MDLCLELSYLDDDLRSCGEISEVLWAVLLEWIGLVLEHVLPLSLEAPQGLLDLLDGSLDLLLGGRVPFKVLVGLSQVSKVLVDTV